MVNRVLPKQAPVPRRQRRRSRKAVSGASSRRTIDRRRRRNIREPLVRLDDAAEAGPGFGKTFVNDRQQRPRRERLAQAARGAEFERRRRVEVGKGVSRHRNQRNRRRALVTGVTTVALVGAGPSWSTAEAVSRCGQSDAKPEPATIERAQCRSRRTAVRRTLCGCSRAIWPAHKAKSE